MTEDIVMQISVRRLQNGSLGVTLDKRPDDSLTFIVVMRELAVFSRDITLTEADEINRKLYSFGK